MPSNGDHMPFNDRIGHVVSKAIYANWETEQRQYKRPCHPKTQDAVLADIDTWIHDHDTTCFNAYG